ncbi:MAG: hypothetical protein NTW87_29530 [Planctomycetota bacterium]|nr:hypothetical protein [Planctomycetota bacterium]
MTAAQTATLPSGAEQQNGRPRWRIILWSVVGAVVFPGACVCGYLSLAASEAGGLLGLMPPLIVRAGEYTSIVSGIDEGSLAADAKGVLKLPRRLASVAPRGEVYVERKPDGRLFVLFPTWYGHGNDLQGYLYASGPLTAADYYEVDWGQGGVRRHLDICGRGLLTVSGNGPYYTVMRRLD